MSRLNEALRKIHDDIELLDSGSGLSMLASSFLLHDLKAMLGHIGYVDCVSIIHDYESRLPDLDDQQRNDQNRQTAAMITSAIERGTRESAAQAETIGEVSGISLLHCGELALPFNQYMEFMDVPTEQRLEIRCYIGQDEAFPLARLVLIRKRLDELGMVFLFEAWGIDPVQKLWRPVLADTRAASSVGTFDGLWIRVLASSEIDSQAIRQALSMDGIFFFAVQNDSKPALKTLQTVADSDLSTAVMHSRNHGFSPASIGLLQPGRLSEYLHDLASTAMRIAGAEQREIAFVAVIETDVCNDRLLLELAACLMQLISNAVIHGIETPGERSGAEKSRTGLLLLTQWVSGAGWNVALSDDGRGIDVHTLGGGVVDDLGAVMHLTSIKELLVKQGLSTRQEASVHAGRGMGMGLFDAQLTQVLGGEWSAESSKGNGTTIQLSLPVSMVPISCAIVCMQEIYFAIPEILMVHTGEIERKCIQGSQGEFFILYMGKKIALVEPWRHFGIEGDGVDGLWPSDICNFVIVRFPDERLQAIPYSSILGTETCLLQENTETLYSRQLAAWVPIVVS